MSRRSMTSIRGRFGVSMWFVFVLGAPAAATAFTSLSVYGNACQEGDCVINLPLFVPTDLYVIAVSNDLSEATGAEFRIDGLPAGLFVIPVADPRLAMDPGDAFGAGARVSFTACQPFTRSVLVVYHTQILAIAPVLSTLVTVREHQTPSLPCSRPLVTLCDEPVRTAQCVLGGVAGVNWRQGWVCCQFPDQCGGICTTAIKHSTWSRVKSLYSK